MLRKRNPGLPLAELTVHRPKANTDVLQGRQVMSETTKAGLATTVLSLVIVAAALDVSEDVLMPTQVRALKSSAKWQVPLCDECRSVLGRSRVLTCDQENQLHRFCVSNATALGVVLTRTSRILPVAALDVTLKRETVCPRLARSHYGPHEHRRVLFSEAKRWRERAQQTSNPASAERWTQMAVEYEELAASVRRQRPRARLILLRRI